MASYALFTLLLLFSSIIFSKMGNKKNLGGLILLLTIMVLMATFRRYDVGNDTPSYFKFFHQMSLGNTNYDSRIEIGYRYLNIFVTQFSNNFSLLLLISSILLFVPIFIYFIKFSDNPILCGLLFWLIGFTTIISATRQAIAIGFLYVALYFLASRKRILFVIFCIIASFFHTFAILFIVLLFLMDRKVTMINGFIFIVVFALLALTTDTFSNFLVSHLGLYYAEYIGTRSGILAILFNSFLGFTFLLFDRVKNKNNSKDLSNSHTYNIAKWSTLLYICFFIASYNISIAGRVTYYFIPALILFIAHVCKRKVLLTILLIIALILYNILAIRFRPGWNSFFPFYFIWQ